MQPLGMLAMVMILGAQPLGTSLRLVRGSWGMPVLYIQPLGMLAVT